VRGVRRVDAGVVEAVVGGVVRHGVDRQPVDVLVRPQQPDERELQGLAGVGEVDGRAVDDAGSFGSRVRADAGEQPTGDVVGLSGHDGRCFGLVRVVETQRGDVVLLEAVGDHGIDDIVGTHDADHRCHVYITCPATRGYGN